MLGVHIHSSSYQQFCMSTYYTETRALWQKFLVSFEEMGRRPGTARRVRSRCVMRWGNVAYMWLWSLKKGQMLILLTWLPVTGLEAAMEWCLNIKLVMGLLL